MVQGSRPAHRRLTTPDIRCHTSLRSFHTRQRTPSNNRSWHTHTHTPDTPISHSFYATVRYTTRDDTKRCDIFTCAQKLTNSQLYLPHGTKKTENIRKATKQNRVALKKRPEQQSLEKVCIAVSHTTNRRFARTNTKWWIIENHNRSTIPSQFTERCCWNKYTDCEE